MEYTRPTIEELRDQFLGYIDSRLGNGQSALSRRTNKVIAYVMARAIHDLYGWFDWLLKQCTPARSTGLYLTLWASVFGLSRKAATYASGTVIFNGNDGSTVPKGAIVQNQGGQQFATTHSADIAAGEARVNVRAIDAGAADNTPAHQAINLTNPIAGITSATTAQEAISGGTDTEQDDPLRRRLLFRIQNPPRGGANHDYIHWATSIAGVSWAKIIPVWQGGNTVGVIVYNDQNPDLQPGETVVQAVQDYLGRYKIAPGVAPVTANVTVMSPYIERVDHDIAIKPNNAATREAVTLEVQDLYNRMPEGFALSELEEAVSRASGIQDRRINSPSAGQYPDNRSLLQAGEFTFSSL